MNLTNTIINIHIYISNIFTFDYGNSTPTHKFVRNDAKINDLALINRMDEDLTLLVACGKPFIPKMYYNLTYFYIFLTLENGCVVQLMGVSTQHPSLR